MRLYACFLLTVGVLQARAASIPETAQPYVVSEKNIVGAAPEEIKENASCELVDPNPVKDPENNLRAKPEDIPVAVINEKIANEVSDEENVKRPVIDLDNPGLPQRQEHDTQNAKYYSEDHSAYIVKENIQEAQITLRQGFQGISDNINSFFSNNEQVQGIQSSIAALQETFTTQVQKLNESLQGFMQSNRQPEDPVAAESHTKALRELETDLKSLEDKFNNGVKALSEGVAVAATLRADGETAAGGAAAAGGTNPAGSTSPPALSFPNYMMQAIANINTNLQNSLQNLNTAMSNIISSAPWNNSGTNQPGTQADPVVGSSTQRPSIFTNIQNSINNLLNTNQNQQAAGQQTPPNDPVQQDPQPLGPFAQAAQNFQNLPVIQNVLNYIQPNRVSTTSKPVSAPVTAAGSNAVPAKPEEALAQPETELLSQPAASAPTTQSVAAPSNVGPIRQILSKNPVVQGIAAAAQRLQNSITNPEKPRDEAVTDKADEQEKGGLFFGGKPPFNANIGHSDNSDSGINELVEKKGDIIPEEPKKEETLSEVAKEEEKKPVEVSVKTE